MILVVSRSVPWPGQVETLRGSFAQWPRGLPPPFLGLILGDIGHRLVTRARHV